MLSVDPSGQIDIHPLVMVGASLASAPAFSRACSFCCSVSVCASSYRTAPDPAALLSTYCLIALFCTGLTDDADTTLSTVTFVAPAAMPSSLALSALDIRPAADCVAVAVPALPSSAAAITLFCSGLALASDSALSTMTFVAPAAMPSSLALSALDIRPLADAVAAVRSAFASQAAAFSAVMPSSTARFSCVCRAFVLAAICWSCPGAMGAAPLAR